jgi:anti-sigma factor RsiW
MTHEHHQQRISLYADNALNDRETAKLFAHLSRCNECRAFLKMTLHLHAHIVDEKLEEVPHSLDRSVLADVAAKAVSAQSNAWYAPVWFTRISIPLPAAASILFLIIVGSLLFSPILAQPPQPETKIPAQLESKIPASLQQLQVNK